MLGIVSFIWGLCSIFGYKIMENIWKGWFGEGFDRNDNIAFIVYSIIGGPIFFIATIVIKIKENGK